MIDVVASGMVSGYLHRPERPAAAAIVLSHGAGSNANSRLLVALAAEFADRGVAALRIDLPFRQARTSGPPHPSSAARDREGIHAAAQWMRGQGFRRVFLGGHSYGGRQTSILASEQPASAAALLLCSYPLHPPRKPDQLRTAHFPALRTPALFLHGTRDPFGSPDELRAVMPQDSELHLVDGAGHELKPLISRPGLAVDVFLKYCGSKRL